MTIAESAWDIVEGMVQAGYLLNKVVSCHWRSPMIFRSRREVGVIMNALRAYIFQLAGTRSTTTSIALVAVTVTFTRGRAQGYRTSHFLIPVFGKPSH